MKTKILDEQTLRMIQDGLRKFRRFVICTHVSPDGDAIGSALGWSSYLTALGKEVSIIVPNYFPDFLHWMEGSDRILLYDRYRDLSDRMITRADVICCLDFNGLGRIEEMGEAVRCAHAVRWMIDHHLMPEDFCQVVVSHPEMSSTCELVFRVIDELGGADTLSKAAAESLYCGMCTDTGGFTYNSNSSEIYYIISRLLEKGIDKDLIYRRIYNNYSVNRIRLMGYVLYEKLLVMEGQNAACFTLNKEEQKQFHFLKGDAEGLVNIPLTIKGMRLSASFREDTEKPRILVSLRSVDDFPCNRMAEEFFNGGGHLNAAGGRLTCTMEEAVEVFRKAVEKYKPLLVIKK